MLGFNYRMGEIEAAIAEAQLGRLDALTEPRIAHAAAADRGARRTSRGLTAPRTPRTATGTSSTSTRALDAAALGVSARPVRRGAARRGRPASPRATCGRSTAQPLYQRRAAARRSPILATRARAATARASCPTCERMHDAGGPLPPARPRGPGARPTSTTSRRRSARSTRAGTSWHRSLSDLDLKRCGRTPMKRTDIRPSLGLLSEHPCLLAR